MKHKWHEELEELVNFNIDDFEAKVEPLFTLNQMIEFAEKQVKNNVDLAIVSECEICNESEAKLTVKICHSCDEYVLNSSDR